MIPILHSDYANIALEFWSNNLLTKIRQFYWYDIVKKTPKLIYQIRVQSANSRSESVKIVLPTSCASITGSCFPARRYAIPKYITILYFSSRLIYYLQLCHTVPTKILHSNVVYHSSDKQFLFIESLQIDQKYCEHFWMRLFSKTQHITGCHSRKQTHRSVSKILGKCFSGDTTGESWTFITFDECPIVIRDLSKLSQT